MAKRMTKNPPKFVLVRGIFLGKGFKIAPQIPIENLYADSDYVESIHPEDAVIVNLEDRWDRRNVDDTLRALYQDYHADRQRVSILSKELMKESYIPNHFDGALRTSHLFDHESLLGLTFQNVNLGPQKSVFSLPLPGETPFRASDIESLLIDMRELTKAHKKKQAAFQRREKTAAKKKLTSKPEKFVPKPKKKSASKPKKETL